MKMRVNHRWTTQDIAMVTELYPKKTAYQVARLMNKTRNQIEYVLQTYGIRNANRKNVMVTACQRRQVIALREEGYTYGQIVIKTGVKKGTVKTILDWERRKHGKKSLDRR